MRDPQPAAPAEFTTAGYRALVEAFLQRGYQARAFTEPVPTGPQMILRHDLDMSIEAAIPIAEIEHDLGVRSTYFVLMRTEMYNPFSQRGREALRRIIELGHAIGLHFDTSPYGDSTEELDRGAAMECSSLEAIIGVDVDIVSFHRPAPALQGLDRKVGGRRHTYEPALFQEIGYCSDSRGGWHHGSPLDHDAVARNGPLQLLTHPIWWVASAGETVRQKLDRFALGRFDLLRAELAANCEAYPQEFRTLMPGPFAE